MRDISLLRPKLSLLLLLLFSLNAYSQQLASVQQPGTNTIYHQDDQEMTLKSLLLMYEKKYKVSIVFNSQAIGDQLVTITKFQDEVLEKSLSEVLKPLGLQYKKIDKEVYVIQEKKPEKEELEKVETEKVMPQSSNLPLLLRNKQLNDLVIKTVLMQTISGTVNDGLTGDPLPGINVLAKGTTQGTVTDIEGKYRITVNDDVNTLVFSSIGYNTQEVLINGRNTINISLDEDVTSLEEVVVVGYGTVERKDLTGSVASADIEAFQDQPNVSIVQSLQGTVAGLNVGAVTSPGGNPGFSVRGRTSLSGAGDPLIVLDGIIYRGSLVDINIADVKSVDVLKDASSKAIYGSQAANGVIIITTKQGRGERKPVFNFSSYLALQTPAMMINPSDREGYIDKTRNYYWEEAFLAPDYTERDPSFDPTTRFAYPELVDGFNDGTSTDWLDVATQNSYIQNTNMSMAGSTEKSSYFISAGITDNKGYMKNDNFSKINLRVNFDNEIAEGWTIGLQTFMSSADYSGVPTDMFSTHLLSPLVAPYNEDGTLNVQPQGAVRNPLANLEIDDLDKRLNLFGTFFTEIQIPFVKGLSYRLNYSTNYRTRRNNRYDPFGNTNQGSAFKNNSLNTDRTIDNILTYSRTFYDKHDVKVTLLYGNESRSGDDTGARSGIFLNQALGYNSLESGATDQQLVSSGAFEEEALYQMGRLNYGYEDRYLATVTVRRDGFSGFGVNNKFGLFPSLGLGWVASNEAFMADASWINNLKLRGTYGRSGNRTVGRYQTLARVSGRFLYVFGDGGESAYGQFISALANNDLGWETTTGLNVGMDFSVLNNRVSGSIDYYDNVTEDILFNINIPRMTGFSSLPTNIGEVANNGLEISLSSTNVRKDGFEWRSNFVFSRNVNEIVSILGRDDDGDGNEDDLIANGLFIGEAIGAINTYTVDGLYQIGDDIPSSFRPGQYRLRNLDDNEVITPLGDRSIVGYTEPAYRFGIRNEFSYKNWTVSAFVNSIQGGDNGYYASNSPIWDSNNSDNWNMPVEYNYWTPSNPNAQWNGLRYDNPVTPPILQQRSFVRLQDVNITYNLPANLLEKLSIGATRLFISGKNLATWTNWSGGDPETASGINTYSLPVMKSITFGVNLTF